MSSLGCGQPIIGDVVCGQRYTYAPTLPILCAPCQRAWPARDGKGHVQQYGAFAFNAAELATLRQAAVAEGYCEACLDAKATSTSPNLCGPCRDEYARDLAQLDVSEGAPGSRCTSACGHCGRCGDA